MDLSLTDCNSEKAVRACEDIVELYWLYWNNWFDIEGNWVPINSVTLELIKKDINCIDVLLFIQMSDLQEDALFQRVAENCTAEEADFICQYAKQEVLESVSVISVC